MMEGDLSRVRGLLDSFAAAEARARQRLEAVDAPCWYYGIVGVRLEENPMRVGSLFTIREVEESAGEISLARALRNQAEFGTVGRYTRIIRHQMVLPNPFEPSDPRHAVPPNDLAYALLAALRVRAGADFIVPAVSDTPWDAIAALSDNSCSVHMVEDIPLARRYSHQETIAVGAGEWVGAHFDGFLSLLGDVHGFRTAVSACMTHNYTTEQRLAIATLWAGIEAMFNVSSELTFRLSLTIASLLAERGEPRYALYKKLLGMYGVRSKAVHGGDLSKAKLDDHIRDTREILAGLVCLATERGAVFDRGAMDRLLTS